MNAAYVDGKRLSVVPEEGALLFRIFQWKLLISVHLDVVEMFIFLK